MWRHVERSGLPRPARLCRPTSLVSRRLSVRQARTDNEHGGSVKCLRRRIHISQHSHLGIVQHFSSTSQAATSSSTAAAQSVKGKEPERRKEPRKNVVGVQLLSPSLHAQLFPEGSSKAPLDHLVKLSKKHLREHGLEPGESATINEINFELPALQGSNIRQHFYNIGSQIAGPYLRLAEEFSTATLPPQPEWFVTDQPGWIRYDQDGSFMPVDDLSDETFVSFDVEVLYKLSPYPVMACAASSTHWYSWLSPTIFEDPPAEPIPPRPKWDKSLKMEHPHDLIPLFDGSKPRIAVGHNVGYDRARVAEEYSLAGTKTRWMDTLSLHAASRGISSNQAPAWHSYRKQKQNDEIVMDAILETEDQELISRLTQSDDDGGSQTRWEDITAINSLSEVAALHCGYAVDKSVRERFGDESITHASQLRDELQDLLQYNADDVKITHDVYTKVFPLFRESCPHPASFAGILPMGTSFLPVDQSWQTYLKNAEELYRKMEESVKSGLKLLAERVREKGPQDDDPWLSQLDWSPKKARWATDGAITATDDASSASSKASSIPAEGSSTFDVPHGTPSYLAAMLSDPATYLSSRTAARALPLLLHVTYKGHPVAWTSKGMWSFRVPKAEADQYPEHEEVDLVDSDEALFPFLRDYSFLRVARAGKSRVSKILAKTFVKSDGDQLDSDHPELMKRVIEGSATTDEIMKIAQDMKSTGDDDVWAAQLDWSDASHPSANSGKTRKPRVDYGTWPKWYWELTSPHSTELDLTQKKAVTPLLLRLQWQGYPLVRHPEFKWLFRVPRSDLKPDVTIGVPIDPNDSVKITPETLFDDITYAYFRLPHRDGETKNVGSPFAKAFVNAIESKELAPAVDASDSTDEMARIAADAMNLNVLCSYWISSRERIMDQMVVYQNENQGVILPQCLVMGTVTRRAVEATWLTASNAKAKRVGSELKAMVKSPPGYAIVGADVDSEELWLSSVMGDAQFGFHGATAIGYMTLEGSKSKGTDLHSKTASIIGTSRDAAKVFNYSRIYGAGQKHAVQLLRQGDATLTKEEAMEKAVKLYEATKGHKSRRGSSKPPAAFASIWHGGSESFLFNLIETIAGSESPRTPALGCGVTSALRKGYLEDGSAYLPSRTNWVVQSSGVDYLHLLITSMEYLINRYNIKARYLISVHDEVRYLSKEEDRYRTALALQIANAWTRALFCYSIGMDDCPQSVAFFSAVDLDHVLRKEVFLPCQTPSHPEAIPPGESLDMEQLLAKTNNGDLGPVQSIEAFTEDKKDDSSILSLFSNLDSHPHFLFLRAQADRSPILAQRWLDQQPPLLDTLGRPLPKERKKRKEIIKASVQENPGHFQRQREAAFQFSPEEIDEITKLHPMDGSI
ncbi:DNA polymerase family A-domain-containing protein [Kockovaella imperatae]|uniref:Mitochondrial DNA polymerase catalytic subunit n=1 Tax=Kockovaella imperatae TaxID=4999 RepID=A0A1Y1UNK4_9TREE|nr:DNA polymerase family A-domain-containing protein [Kockovaella imperatae]ORX39640.1 DNA polymerase family A-domain-containing protein [Kockovaella imperatae]